MSVNDPDEWIVEETAFIRSALHTGRPMIGVCLGSQFMAKALGASVTPGKLPEIGMTAITLSPEARHDRVFRTLPDSFDVFEWHGEVFNLPQNCIPLAASAVAPLQAFRYGTHAYGLLFHLEIEAEGVETLCQECANDLLKAKVTAGEITAAVKPRLFDLHRLADGFIGEMLYSQH